MEVVEALAGMVSSMLEFPLVGFLGRLVPDGGSEAGKQVRCDLSSEEARSVQQQPKILPRPRKAEELFFVKVSEE